MKEGWLQFLFVAAPEAAVPPGSKAVKPKLPSDKELLLKESPAWKYSTVY
jgi:hypothetical protein